MTIGTSDFPVCDKWLFTLLQLSGVSPPPRSIGIVMLALKREIISWNQWVAGKILGAQDLGSLRASRHITPACDDGLMGLWKASLDVTECCGGVVMLLKCDSLLG